MAWRSHGATNEDMVESLWRNGLITDPRVKAAFLEVDRAHYAPIAPYQDRPQPLGHGATISAPHMHAAAAAHLLAWLARRCPAPARRPRVLDIGSGSGYLTHVLALLAGPAARVVGLDHLPALRALGEANMAKSPGGRALLAAGRVRFRLGDGRKGWREEGEEEGGEWDVIHVGASAAEVHPELLAGLARGGRMFIPVDDGDGEGGQSVWTVDRDADGRVTRERLFGVRYVPLTDAPRE